ncbi:hypothetical protein [Mycolicibacterium mengxianglii]|uniref:hypothetical protein n=1 Tax=Mycolicibacterium mengxianglii TaxID=2736649 RepID=UPI0018EF2AAD|nr:hypothetical protein [Mycolicibacterium mengxianglii]
MLDDLAIAELASRGADVAEAYATAVHRIMQQRITRVYLEAVCLRTAQAAVLAAASDSSQRGQTLAFLCAAVAAHHYSVLNARVADVIAYGTVLGTRIPRDVLALGAPTAE